MLLLRRRPLCWPALVSLACAAGLVAGCASPGSPRPPSLHLPEPVRDVSALRSGDEVQLRFSVPRRTTDGQSIAGIVLQGSLCRQSSAIGPCKPVSLPENVSTLQVPGSASQGESALWVDHLPPDLCSGPVRPIAYRITLSNEAGRSAGTSDPVYTAAGAAPPPVLHLEASGSRAGVLLQWAPAVDKSDVLLQRAQIDPKPEPVHAPPAPQSQPTKAKHAKPRPEARHVGATPPAANGTVVLRADAQSGAGKVQTIDNTVMEGVRYTYQAVRQTTAQVGGRTLVLQSAPSVPVEIAWRDVYPPPAPQQLTALGYATGAATGGNASEAANPGYAVDLIWQPVDDPRVVGYLVRRQALQVTGEREGTPESLNTTPVKTPGFHDSTAQPGTSYRYDVVAVDAKGNVSPPATAKVDRQGAQP